MIFKKYLFGSKLNIQFIKELNSIINSKSKVLFLICIFSSALTGLIDLTLPISLYNLFKVIEGSDTGGIFVERILTLLPKIFKNSFEGALILVFISVVLSNLLRFMTLFVNTRTSAYVTQFIISNLYKKILSSEYSKINKSNLKTKFNSITAYSPQIMGNIFLGFLQIISFLSSASLIITGLYLSYPNLMLILIIFLLIYYSLIIKLSSRKVKNYNNQASSLTNKIFSSINESLENIAYTKVENLSDYYSLNYLNLQRILRRIQSNAYLLGGSPRFVLEISFIAFVVILILFFGSSFNSGLSDFVFIIVAFQRALPSFQNSYSSVTGIKTCFFMLRELLDFYKFLEIKRTNPTFNLPTIEFSNNYNSSNLISFQNVYVNAFEEKNININLLSNLSFNINKKQWINIIGKSGSGKTTLIETICGLRLVDYGIYKFNNQIIDSFEKAKHLIYPELAYVSQSTNFNGLSPEEIVYGLNKRNEYKFKELINLLNLENLLSLNPPNENYRLSGGERQRLIIARALYKNPKILILDEATSSLDIQTQEKILKYLHSKLDKMTIIFITHRLEALKYGDLTFKMENGSIKIEYK